MQLNNVFINWLKNRKISDEVIESFQLQTEGERLVIPVCNEHGIFSFNKYRRSPLVEYGSKYTYDKGGKVTLYGSDRIEGHSKVLITEGEIDTLVAWSANIPSVTSTGGALSFQAEWAELLKDKEVIICFDNDSAGGEGMVKTLSILPHAQVLFLPDRPGIKDISDFVSQGGNIHALLNTAKKLHSLEDVIEDRANRISLFQSTYFHDAYIKYHTKPVIEKRERVVDSGTKDKIARAKEYPITELLPFNSSHNTRCLWHNERTASLHYYPQQNRCWCFGGCGRGYDAIDVYRKLNNVGFKDAVNALQ